MLPAMHINACGNIGGNKGTPYGITARVNFSLDLMSFIFTFFNGGFLLGCTSILLALQFLSLCLFLPFFFFLLF